MQCLTVESYNVCNKWFSVNINSKVCFFPTVPESDSRRKGDYLLLLLLLSLLFKKIHYKCPLCLHVSRYVRGVNCVFSFSFEMLQKTSK